MDKKQEAVVMEMIRAGRMVQAAGYPHADCYCTHCRRLYAAVKAAEEVFRELPIWVCDDCGRVDGSHSGCVSDVEGRGSGEKAEEEVEPVARAPAGVEIMFDSTDNIPEETMHTPKRPAMSRLFRRLAWWNYHRSMVAFAKFILVEFDVIPNGELVEKAVEWWIRNTPPTRPP